MDAHRNGGAVARGLAQLRSGELAKTLGLDPAGVIVEHGAPPLDVDGCACDWDDDAALRDSAPRPTTRPPESMPS